MSKIIRRIISTPLAAKPDAPFCQAMQVGNTLYVSGVVGFDLSLKLVKGGALAEARQCLTNLKFILEAANTSLENVVKTTILLNDIKDFGAINELYKEYFKEPYPARSTYQVGKLPVGASVEIEAIAVVGDVETRTEAAKL